MNPTVSSITVTQYSRRQCLTNLAMLIKQQIYKNITEWVIVEGSKTAAKAETNAGHIVEIKDLLMVPIVYVPFEAEQHLSDLRNKGNAVCRGEIIVCFDDDDYYPPTRVSHAVYKLTNSSKMIAGCSKAPIYFYKTGQFFQFKGFGETHSTNNCLAYKRAYLEKHCHAPGLDKAEESSFTDSFSEPMEQLDPMKTMVISGHGNNTVDKNWISKSKMVIELNGALLLDFYMPLPVILKMEKIFEDM